MRVISLCVVFSQLQESRNHGYEFKTILAIVQSFFQVLINTNYYIKDGPNHTYTVIWSRLLIDDDKLLSLASNLETRLLGASVLIIPLDADPTWWNKHKTFIMGLIGVLIAILFGVFSIMFLQSTI